MTTNMSNLERSHLYRFLAANFLTPPSKEMIETACDKDLLSRLSISLSSSAVEGLLTFDRSSTSLETIQQSYMDLFRIPMGINVSPYESIYLDSYINEAGKKRKRLMGPSAQHVSLFYDAAGCDFTAPEICGNMPDYIGAELAFMSYLTEQEQNALEVAEQEQSVELRTLQWRFLEEHLTCWISPLCKTIMTNDPLGYYKGIAQLMLSFVTQDFESIKQDHQNSDASHASIQSSHKKIVRDQEIAV